MGPHGLNRCGFPPRGGRGPRGNLPFPIRPPAKAEACSEGNLRDCTPEELAAQQEAAQADQATAMAIIDAFSRAFVHVRPSPLDAVPFRGRVEEIHARKVIAPPTTPGDSDGAAGATAVANAETAITGDTIDVLTPATVSAYVDIVSFTVPKGRVLVVNGVGTWGHDYYAVRDVIKWRVMASGQVLAKERELGLAGSIQAPARVKGVLYEGQTLTVQARNLDTASGSLVECYVDAWSLPVSPELGNADILEGLLPDQRSWNDRRRPFQGRDPFKAACKTPEGM